MNKKLASKLWVELNLGRMPIELKDASLHTSEEVWAKMTELAKFASRSEVNRLWDKENGITGSDIAMKFGHP